MELTPRDVDQLLGAWALGALDPEEAAAVDRALAADPALALTAERLRQAADALGGATATPPERLRSDVLTQADRHPPTLVVPTDPVTLFANQVAAMVDLVDGLTETEYEAPTAPYDWTVHGLLAHLLVIERYMAGQLGLRPRHPDGAADHLEIGAAEIADRLRHPGADTAGEWHRTATATLDALADDGGPALDAQVEFHRWPLSTGSLLIARSFEIWTHTDDIRRATGRPAAEPAAADLRAMSSFSVSTLPLVLPLVAPDADFGGARIVLTGAGGGTVDLGDPARREVLIATDVVDYCRLASRRIDIDALDATIEGEHGTATNLLAAARVFAL